MREGGLVFAALTSGVSARVHIVGLLRSPYVDTGNRVRVQLTFPRVDLLSRTTTRLIYLFNIRYILFLRGVNCVHTDIFISQ